jgi:hypothetical protein
MLHFLQVVKDDDEELEEEDGRLKCSCRSFLIGSVGLLDDEVPGPGLLFNGTGEARVTSLTDDETEAWTSARKDSPVEKSGSGLGFGVKNARNVDWPGVWTGVEAFEIWPFLSTFLKLEPEAPGCDDEVLGLNGDLTGVVVTFFLTHRSPSPTTSSLTISSLTGEIPRILISSSKIPTPLSDDGIAEESSLDRNESDLVREGGDKMGKSGASRFFP